MKEEFNRLSIKSNLLLFSLCISLIPIALVTIIYYLSARSELKRHVLNELTAVAESKRLHVRTLMEAKKGRTLDFCSDGFVKDSLETMSHIRSLSDNTVTALNKHLLTNKKSLDPQITATAVADKTGSIVASTHDILIGKDMSDHAVFTQTVGKKPGELSVACPHNNPNLKANVISIASPVVYGGGTDCGVFVNYYDIAILGEIMTNRIGLGKTGEAYLVNRDKLMLTNSRFIADAPLKLTVDTEPVRKIAEEGKEMAGIYPDYRGVPIVGASANIPEYGWTLLVEIDKAEAFAPLKTLNLVALITGGISSTIVIGIGILYAVSIAAPIHTLKDATEKFGHGDLKYRVAMERNDEIGELACSFNVMAEKLAREITLNEHAQKQLRDFFHTVKQCSSMILITDINGNIEYVNPKFTQITGYTEEEVLRQNPKILQSGNTPAEAYKRLWETITSGGIWDGELLNKKKSGELYWESASISSVRDDDGNIYRFIKVSEDITAHKQNKRRMETQYAVISVLAESTTLKDASKRILKALCECLEWDVGGIWVYDLHAHVLRCVELWHVPSREFPEFEAVSRETTFLPGVGLPGRVWSSAKPAWISDVVPDPNFPRSPMALKEGLHGAFGFPILSGNRVLGVIEFFSHEIQQPDGDLLNLMGAIGKQIGLFLNRKQMEEQILKLSRVVEQGANTVIITDTKGNIEYVNPKFTQLTGYEPEEVIGQNPRILKSGETSQEEYRRLWETITSGEVWRGEFLNKRKNSELFWEATSIFPIKNDEGVITNFIGIKEDITKRKQMDDAMKKLNESLEQRVAERTKELTKMSEDLKKEINERNLAEEEKERLREQLYHAQRLESVGKLAGGVAHNFNNILMAITGYGGLLQMEMREDDPLQDYVQKILSSSEMAAKLTQGLLAFSKKQINDPKPVNINEITRRIGILLSRLTQEDIELRMDLADKDLTVMADSTQIEQVLMNLITNARDAMPEGGVITIRTSAMEFDSEFIRVHGYGEPGQYALLSVSDTGMGIEEEVQERIFEPFFTTKEVGKGTGLGLAIVYGIIKQYNGFINVNSAPGEGTTFKVYLPLVESEAGEEKSGDVKILKGGTETILLAEDEMEVRTVIKRTLEKYGYRVIEAVDGEDGINKFVENKDEVKLLALDVKMPGKDGKEVCDTIRQMRPDIKVIFMSGYSENIIDKEYLSARRLDFISKPVLITEFLEKVRKALDE